jgi:hypothetical protein
MRICALSVAGVEVQKRLILNAHKLAEFQRSTSHPREFIHQSCDIGLAHHDRTMIVRWTDSSSDELSAAPMLIPATIPEMQCQNSQTRDE